MIGIWVIRGIVLALSAALAVALIARGNVVIGVLVGALVVSRVVLFATLARRRRALRRRFSARRRERLLG